MNIFFNSNYENLKKDLEHYRCPNSSIDRRDQQSISTFHEFYPKFEFGVLIKKDDIFKYYLIAEKSGQHYIMYEKIMDDRQELIVEQKNRIDALNIDEIYKIVFFNEKYMLYEITQKISSELNFISMVQYYCDTIVDLQRNIKKFGSLSNTKKRNVNERLIIGDLINSFIVTEKGIIFYDLLKARYDRIEHDLAQLCLIYRASIDKIKEAIEIMKSYGIRIDKKELTLQIIKLCDSLITHKLHISMFNSKTLYDAKTKRQISKYSSRYKKYVLKKLV